LFILLGQYFIALPHCVTAIPKNLQVINREKEDSLLYALHNDTKTNALTQNLILTCLCGITSMSIQTLLSITLTQNSQNRFID